MQYADLGTRGPIMVLMVRIRRPRVSMASTGHFGTMSPGPPTCVVCPNWSCWMKTNRKWFASGITDIITTTTEDPEQQDITALTNTQIICPRLISVYLERGFIDGTPRRQEYGRCLSILHVYVIQIDTN